LGRRARTARGLRAPDLVGAPPLAPPEKAKCSLSPAPTLSVFNRSHERRLGRPLLLELVDVLDKEAVADGVPAHATAGAREAEERRAPLGLLVGAVDQQSLVRPELFDAHLGAVPEDAAARQPRDHVGAVAMPDLLLAPFDVGDLFV